MENGDFPPSTESKSFQPTHFFEWAFLQIFQPVRNQHKYVLEYPFSSISGLVCSNFVKKVNIPSCGLQYTQWAVSACVCWWQLSTATVNVREGSHFTLCTGPYLMVDLNMTPLKNKKYKEYLSCVCLFSYHYTRPKARVQKTLKN